MKLIIGGQEVTTTHKTLLDIAKELKIPGAITATVNGRLRELSYQLDQDFLKVEFLTLNNQDASRIYDASLRYLIAMALNNLYPDAKIKYSYSVSRSILATIDHPTLLVDNRFLKALDTEVQRLINADYKINRKTLPLEEAIEFYRTQGQLDKVAVLKYRSENKVNIYSCNDYINYMFGYMVPSTGFLANYNLIPYAPGFLIQYPRAEFQGKIPPFIDAPIFGRTLKEVAKWGKIIGGDTIPKMNGYAEEKDLTVDFINLCETKHNNMLAELGNQIYADREEIRLIAIAGPSSSGKTTFTNRLRIELLTYGLKPVMISMDDYYLGKDFAPKDENGNPDLEHIEALDIELFNGDMLKLIQGHEVTLPHFNFKTGKREEGKTVKVNKNSPIMIEGIHALNDRLTSRIPKHQKYKIYIAPQTQLHIDNHNPISITDLRLLRRIVRDKKYRSASALDTINMWQSVRRGEFKWIYPHQEDANYVFNSELTYELNVLKKHAIKELLDIPKDSKHYITANRLVKFLKYFVDIEDDIIPSNSLLREFIGGSPFHD